MDIPYLINLLQNKFNYLNNAKSAAAAVGDISGVTSIEQEILTTQNTIAQLQFLQSINQVAIDTNTSTAEIIENGLSTIKNIQVIPEGPTEVLAFYDITSYATDPLHEEKIADILSVMGVMNTVNEIDVYINNEAIASPVTGQMIFDSAQKYNVDTRLMMALMELDSRFGTAGIAIRTLNPGNVGNNDDGDTRTYPTWDAGVEAVAKWLDNHRIEAETKIAEELKQEEEPEPEAEIEPEEEEPEPEPEPEIEPEPESEIIPEPNPEPISEPEPETEPVLPVIETEPEIITEPVSEPVVSVIKRKRRVI